MVNVRPVPRLILKVHHEGLRIWELHLNYHVFPTHYHLDQP